MDELVALPSVVVRIPVAAPPRLRVVSPVPPTVMVGESITTEEDAPALPRVSAEPEALDMPKAPVDVIDPVIGTVPSALKSPVPAPLDIILAHAPFS